MLTHSYAEDATDHDGETCHGCKHLAAPERDGTGWCGLQRARYRLDGYCRLHEPIYVTAAMAGAVQPVHRPRRRI